MRLIPIRSNYAIKILLGCLLALLLCSPVNAKTRISVETGKATVLPNNIDIDTVFVADTSIADASVGENGQIFIHGKSVGETTLFTTSSTGGGEMQYTIIVTHNMTELRRIIDQRYPSANVSISATRGSVLVSGNVESEGQRASIIQTVETSVPQAQILDELFVSSSNLITLRVRLLEVDRTRADNFGINWDATVTSNGFFLGASDRGVINLGRDENQNSRLNASLDVLTTSGIVAIVQETLLTTVTGKSAEFAVGGEIPIPSYISDNDGDGAGTGNYQLDYKFIGTNLTFTPVSTPGSKLRLDIESVISSASATTTTVNGNSFPNLRSRGLRTSVELQDRQSFLIAGISRQDTSVNLRNSRGNGLSRVVDTIFGSDTKSSSEQELVIVVTPLLTQEKKVDKRIALPRSISNLEHILTTGHNGSSKGVVRLPNAIQVAGFQY